MPPQAPESLIHVVTADEDVALLLATVPWRWEIVKASSLAGEQLPKWLTENTGDDLPLSLPPNRSIQVSPSNERYPRAVAQAISEQFLHGGTFAYVSQTDIWVSVRQIGEALGLSRSPASVRQALSQAGVEGTKYGYRTLYPLSAVANWDAEAAGRVVLRQGQAADFLGFSARAIKNVLERLASQGMPVIRNMRDDERQRRPEVRVMWRDLRQVRRIGLKACRYSSA